jgi:hypothetical protein
LNIEFAAIVGEGDDKWMHLLVSNVTKEVHKKRRLGLTSDAMTALKLIREAESDLGFLEHGDKWREHVTPYFAASQTPEEGVLVRQALGLIDKTFAEADEGLRGCSTDAGA